MSKLKDSPVDSQVSQADIILNRTNMALARSQRLIQSWLPIKVEQNSEQSKEAPEDEDDFRSMSEAAGVGAKLQYDEGLPDGTFQRKKLSSNDKLLEQILGKRAAQAHKASKMKAGKNMAQSEHVAPKPAAKQQKREEVESEDEEGGRATAFSSKKAPKRRLQTAVPAQPVEEPDSKASTIQPDHAEPEPGPTIKSASDSEPDERPTKKKAGSYLDELLAEKARKNKKKKHNK